MTTQNPEGPVRGKDLGIVPGNGTTGSFAATEHGEAAGGTSNASMGSPAAELPYHPALAGLTVEQRDALRHVFHQANEFNVDRVIEDDEALGAYGSDAERQEGLTEINAEAAKTLELEQTLLGANATKAEPDRGTLLHAYHQISQKLDESSLRSLAELAATLEPNATKLRIVENEYGSYDPTSLRDSDGNQVFDVEEAMYDGSEEAHVCEELESFCRDLKENGGWEEFAERTDRRGGVWDIDLARAAQAGR